MNFLPSVPTEVQLPTVRIWAEQARQRALAIRPSERVVQGLVTASGHELATGPLGVLSTPEGRAFVNAVWAADWAAYETEEYRVDYVWLALVVDRFPKGFRLYSVPGEDGAPVPVGHTGFYPISSSTYSQLLSSPEEFVHRGQVVPLSETNESRYLYVFNYSMVAPLRKTECTRILLQKLADDLRSFPSAGLCAITVSDDGRRVAERFHMHHRADIVVGESVETVYGTD